MRIAVSIETNEGLDSQVTHHFGRCPYFALVDVEDNEIRGCRVVENPYFSAHRPGQVPGFIQEQKADVMLSGGMGRRAIQFFEQYKIEAATGARGTVKNAVDAFLEGDLSVAAPCKESLDHQGHHGGHHHDHHH